MGANPPNDANRTAAEQWKAGELGRPLPPDTHAVSFALPKWADVVDYEEKRPRVVERVRTGYPRFVFHPLVLELAARLAPGVACLPFPSELAAAWAAEFVRSAGHRAEVVRRAGWQGVATDAEGMNALKHFWQHTGLIVSSREAEDRLAGRGAAAESEEIRASLRGQLAGFYDCDPADVFLAPTGMAAIFEALRAVRARDPGRRTVQLGFPYVDTFKLQERLGNGGILLHQLEQLEVELRGWLERERLAGCFCEIPGNPLLGSANLRRISPILRRHGVPLIADDVVATPVNVDLSGHADLIATSLTKYIVGSAEAMGGAVICNPRSPLREELKGRLATGHEELLWGADARVLDRQARGFPERMARHNAAGLEIAQRLRAHPAIERVWYPKWEFSEAFEAVRKPGGGWGALITFLPRRAAERSPVIYDRLEFCKGPSLGTVFTLVCPFTLLAHYTELDWAEACGVPRNLIRISVGLEPVEEIWRRLERALAEPGG